MWTDSMYNTYAQFANKEKCKVLHCLIFLTQCTQTECSELCHILLTVQTNSKSIIFCITCTHAQYSLHNSVTNSILYHILDTVSYFAHSAQKGVGTQTQYTVSYFGHSVIFCRGVCSAHKLSGTQHEWGWQRIWLQNNAKRTMLQRRCTVSSFLSQYEVISEPTFMKYCTLHCTVIALQLERERDALKLNNTTTANTLITADTPTVWSAC